MIQAALPEEDEDGNELKGNARQVLNMLVNQGNRAYTDIAFYANPSELDHMSKNFIPMMSVFEDGRKFMNAAHDQLGDNPNYKTGTHAEWNKLAYRAGKSTPLVNGLLKLYDNSASIYKKVN